MRRRWRCGAIGAALLAAELHAYGLAAFLPQACRAGVFAFVLFSQAYSRMSANDLPDKPSATGVLESTGMFVRFMTGLAAW